MRHSSEFPNNHPRLADAPDPFVDWPAHYERKHLRGDVLAGVIVLRHFVT